MIMCGKTREALVSAQRGLGIAEQTGSAALICGGMFNLGWIYSLMGQWDTALDLFRQGQVLAQRHELRSRYIDFLAFEGDILLNRGEYSQGSALFEHIMALGKEFDLPQAVSIAENQLAYIELVQGRVNDDEGIATMLQSATLPIDSLGKAHGVITTLGRWAMLAEQGATLYHDPTSFPALAAASAEFMSKHGYAAFQPIAFLVNGMLNTVLGHHKAAQSYLSRGIRVARAIDNAGDLARCLLQRGKLGLLDQSTIRQARRDLNEAAHLFESFQARPQLEETLSLLHKIGP
jgi:tetratricopeptide (TPR) repeat protein